MKKIPTRITPYTREQEKISMRKEKKAVRKPKKHKSSRNSNARGHVQSLENATFKIK
jgi:hypothetical protein